MKTSTNTESSTSFPEFRAMTMEGPDQAISGKDEFDNGILRSASFPCLAAPKGKATVSVINTNGGNRNSRGSNTPSLTRVDSLYPLGSHRMFAMSDMPELVKRIVNAFQKLSLETSSHEYPSFHLKCHSLDQVDFVVNLWQSFEDPGKAIVEIQRIAGDAIAYGRYERSILAAAFDSSSIGDLVHDQGAAVDRCDSILRMLPVEDFADSISEALEIVTHLLFSDRYDARCLGLESLSILTDPIKTSRPLAILCAKACLTGKLSRSDGSVQTDNRIQNRIFFLAVTGRWPDIPAEGDEYSMKYYKAHSQIALLIMANATSLLTDGCDLAIVLEDAKRVTGHNLIFLMESAISHAQSQPHRAYLATRILSAFCRSQKGTVCRCVEPNAVRAAKRVGHNSHAALETESDRLLLAMAEAA